MSTIQSLSTNITRADFEKWQEVQKQKILNRAPANGYHFPVSNFTLPEYLEPAYKVFLNEFELPLTIDMIPVSYLLLFIDTCLECIPVTFSDEMAQPMIDHALRQIVKYDITALGEKIITMIKGDKELQSILKNHLDIEDIAERSHPTEIPATKGQTV